MSDWTLAAALMLASGSFHAGQVAWFARALRAESTNSHAARSTSVTA